MAQALRVILDRTRKHATVHGEVEHGLAYKQDGLPFNAQGELIEALVVTPDQKATLERKLKKAKANKSKPQAADPVQQPVQAQASDEDDDDDALTDEDINFDAWARGIERYEWIALQRAAKKRFAKVFTSKEQLVEFLVFDEKIIALADVAPALRPKADD